LLEQKTKDGSLESKPHKSVEEMRKQKSSFANIPLPSVTCN